MPDTPAYEVPDHSVQISTDRGGTFTDCYYSFPDPKREARTEGVVKLLSVDKANYADAPTVSSPSLLLLSGW